MCLVEVGEKKPTARSSCSRKLVPGCQTPVKDGTVIVTNSDKVKAAQKADARIPAAQSSARLPGVRPGRRMLAAGLQLSTTAAATAGCSTKEHQARQGPHRRADHAVHRPLHHVLALRALHARDQRHGRTAGHQPRHHCEIDIFPGEPCNNKLAGNVVDLCPVGALCSKDFLYKQRVWWLKAANSVCPIAAPVAASRRSEQDLVYRLRPRENPQAQGHFMCDEGRFGWKYIHAEERITLPEQRERGGRVISRDWDVVLPAVRRALRSGAHDPPRGIAAVLSPWMTVEEAYLLASYLKSLSANVRWRWGRCASSAKTTNTRRTFAATDRAGEVHDSRREVSESARCRNRSCSTSRARSRTIERHARPGGRRATSAQCILSAAIRKVGSRTSRPPALERRRKL